LTGEGLRTSDLGRQLAEAYIFNQTNRAASDRAHVFSVVAIDRTGDPSPVDFILNGGYLRHADRELEELAASWDPYLVNPVRRALDAGCGAGVTTLALASRYGDANVIGVDVEKTALDLADYLARDEPRCSFRHERLESFQDPEGFDLIQSRCVLEHVYNPRYVLGSLIRHLSPGGVLYVETPNYLYPWEPHIEMPILPKSPKWLVRAQCRLTGRDPAFVDHLNFDCDPVTLPRWARKIDPNIEIVDLMAQKVAAIFAREDVQPRVASRARRVAALKRFPLAAWVARCALTNLPLAPTAMFLIVKQAG
jgi:2-polyprenyl-3-methyl-5-hydroxy-6-metoxy-1,4-benzoquinol methylase